MPDETVSVMLLVTMPALLLAMSEYVTLSATCALTMVNVLVWLPEIVDPLAAGPSATFTPLVCHCNVGVGTPDTVGLMVTVLPTEAAWLPKPVMLGVTMTESVMKLVTDPSELLAIKEYIEPSCAY